MASTFKFHSQINEVVPWQAQYTFPTQSTKVNKQIVKLPPKNGAEFKPGNIIRIEFPADNYLNTLNSVLSFDLKLTNASQQAVTMQRGGAQNIIKRLRVMYGSLVIEDIQEYKTLVRILAECGVQQDYMASSGTILDGMAAGTIKDWGARLPIPGNPAVDGARAGLQGGEQLNDTAVDAVRLLRDYVYTGDVQSFEGLTVQRTFALNLLSGLLTCKKLVPLKWMAAQLAIEITLATAEDCLLSNGTNTSYVVDNVNYIAEMLEFDSTYDQAFFMGLQQGGVPLKFSSWHFHSFNLSGNNYTAQIHERSRSVKAAIAVVRDAGQLSLLKDSDRFFHAIKHDYASPDTTGIPSVNPYHGAITEFQWRVGGRYYPSQPVKCMGGGSEPYCELMKTLNMLGDYTKASNIDQYNYTSSLAYPSTTDITPVAGFPSKTSYPHLDGKFIIACEFENIDVMPDTIAGINAEEQSDIALNIKATAAAANKKLDVFMHFDCLIVVKDANVVELIL